MKSDHRTSYCATTVAPVSSEESDNVPVGKDPNGFRIFVGLVAVAVIFMVGLPVFLFWQDMREFAALDAARRRRDAETHALEKAVDVRGAGLQRAEVSLRELKTTLQVTGAPRVK